MLGKTSFPGYMAEAIGGLGERSARTGMQMAFPYRSLRFRDIDAMV
jgi:hypothetical protein